MIRRWILRAEQRIPVNLIIFIAAIFLSNCVNEFTTIYAQPGKPSSSIGLWLSCVASLLAAGLWTALAAKKEAIAKAAQSGTTDPERRPKIANTLWGDVWIRTTFYFGSAVVLSITALAALVIPG